MKRISILCFLLGWLLNGASFAKGKEEIKGAPLSDAHKQWLEVVHWIISDYEKNAFLSLEKDEDRDKFIELFWENRDPTPGTQKNEFKEEHYRRFEYANKQFGRESPIPGWKTDRGKVYILLGKPQFIKRFGNTLEYYPMELWQYSGYKGYGLPNSMYFLFFQEGGVGPYRLYSPLQDGIKSLFIQLSGVIMKTEEELFEQLQTTLDPDVAHASISSIPTEGGDPSLQINSGSITSEVIFAKIDNAKNYDLAKRRYVDDFLKDRPTVQVYTSMDTRGITDAVYWFQGPNGHFYLDYVVEFQPDKLDLGQYEEYYTSLAVDGAITAADKTQIQEIFGSHEIKLTEQQFARIKYLPFQYQGRKPIIPGKYDYTLIMNNNVSRRSATFTHTFEIPDLSAAKLPVLTPIMLLRTTESVNPDDKKLRPFQFGDKLLTPNLAAVYSQKISLPLYHQILFPEKFDAPSGSLVIYYIIRSGDKVEGEWPEPLNIPTHDLVGNAIEFRKDIPLAGISPGNKTLIVEVRQGEKILTRSQPVEFSVALEAALGAWKYAVAIPNYGHTYHNFTLAQQYLRMKKVQPAVALLEETLQEHPDSVEVRTQLMRLALKANQFQRVVDLGTPIEVKQPRNKELLWLLGWAYYGLNRYEEAARFFERLRLEDEKRIEVLNLLADIYFRLDQREKSMERVQQSLALKPDQKDILELKKKLETLQ